MKSNQDKQLKKIIIQKLKAQIYVLLFIFRKV